MSGWKTWVAVAVAFAGGVVKLGQSLLAEPLDANGAYEGLLMIVAAFGLLGIGHKIEKAAK